jgi:hypothetical protein
VTNRQQPLDVRPRLPPMVIERHNSETTWMIGGARVITTLSLSLTSMHTNLWGTCDYHMMIKACHEVLEEVTFGCCTTGDLGNWRFGVLSKQYVESVQ